MKERLMFGEEEDTPLSDKERERKWERGRESKENIRIGI